MKHSLLKRDTLVLIFLFLLKMTMHLWLIDPAYDLHRDEFLHLDQGKHLAWGFESVPPFTSWISWIILQLGNGVFWIKFFPALFGALTMVIVWKAVEALNGDLFAKVLAAVAVMLSAILRLNILYQPNSFDVLCWTLLYFTLIKYISSGKSKWLMATGVAFALGFLNKYNIAFLVLGLIPALLITSQRKIFLRKELYIAAVLALLLISGNLAWQFKNNFPVIHHMRTLTETQLVNVNRMDFIKEQILFFFGSFFIIIASAVGFIFYKPFRQYRVFGWAILFTLILFIYLRAKSYYAIGLYPILLAFGSVYLEYVFRKGWKRYLRPAAVAIILVSFIPLIKIAFPVLSPEEVQEKTPLLKDLGMLRWEDGKDHALPQDFADMQGWSELAHKVDSLYNTIADKEHTLVLCDNYGQTGAINYYTKIKGLQAVSMNADYINWFPLKTKIIKNVIQVKDADDEDKGRTRERNFFKKVELAGSITNPFAREQGTNIYLLEDATVSINNILEEEIERRKKEE